MSLLIQAARRSFSRKPNDPNIVAGLYKFTNIGSLVGYNKSEELVRFDNCDILVKQGKIFKIGQNLTAEGIHKTFDLNKALVTPAFVDPHTHAFPQEDRATEFALRVERSNDVILENGGGIQASVRACRKGTYEEIYAVNEHNVKRFIKQGTMTLEMKSGYGLDLDTEIKLLKVIKDLKIKYRKYIDIIPTFMGAHDIPLEYKDKPEEYINYIIETVLPEVKKQKLAVYCDVFCEEGYFNAELSKKLLNSAKKLGFKARIHADEYKDSDGAKIARLVKAHSADHLMAVSEQGMEHLKKANVVATMLPGTTVFLGLQTFANVRKMANLGIRVAIGTDFNPGSSVFSSQPLMMNFAMAHANFTLEEAFKGVTMNAALSLNKKIVGVIDEGMQADFIAWNYKNIDQIPYYNTESEHKITHYIKKGRTVPAHLMKNRLK